MADYVYCVASTGRTMYLSCDPMELAPIMLRSVGDTNDCKVLMPCYMTDEQRDTLRAAYPGDIEFFTIEQGEVPQLMRTKICKLLEMPFVDGDRVFVMDIDLIVQGPLFDVFEDDSFDVGQTSRHYKYEVPINNGVWCFRYNEAVRVFLQRYADEMWNPEWAPFKRVYPPGCNLRVSDQAYMAAVYMHGPPTTFIDGQEQPACRMKDIGPMYNYCPPDDKMGLNPARAEFRRVLGNTDYRVLHFKGFDIVDGKGRNIKDTMADIGRERGWI